MFGIKTAAEAEQILISVQDQLKMVAVEQPHRVTEAANEVSHWLGVTKAMYDWESDVRDLLEHAQDNAWTDEQVTIGKYQILTRLLVRDSDDKWSGRDNDGKRSYHDGWMDALKNIESNLRFATKVNV